MSLVTPSPVQKHTFLYLKQNGIGHKDLEMYLKSLPGCMA